jgi:RimJ/RimL family protein N-acetyltransferase
LRRRHCPSSTVLTSMNEAAFERIESKRLSIRRFEDGEMGDLVGDCALQVDGQEPYRAEIGFTLARELQGKGFASEAVSRLLDYAFGDLGLHRVVAIADCRNNPSWALLERVGLRQEGHFLQSVWFKGEWSDEYLYAVLKDEWLEKRTN